MDYAELYFMKRVAYLFNHSEIIGGGELSFLDLIDAIREEGIEPVAFVPSEGTVYDRLTEYGVSVQIFRWMPIRIWTLLKMRRSIYRLAQCLQDLNIDLVHVNGARCMLYAGPAARRAKIPCVWHVRVLERDRLLDRWRASYAQAIITNSNAVGNSIELCVGRLVSIHVVYNGFRLESIDAMRPVDAVSGSTVTPGVTLLAAGRFTRWKGFEDLIEACALLSADDIDYTCIIAGSALPDEQDYETDLKKMVHDKNLNSIRFIGWRDDIPALMKSANIFVIPSHEEPFGRVLIEAWASGVPVIATNAGGPAELISHQKNGLLVPVSDPLAIYKAIKALGADTDKGRQLSDAGYQESRKFSIQHHAESIRAIYTSVWRGE